MPAFSHVNSGQRLTSLVILMKEVEVQLQKDERKRFVLVQDQEVIRSLMGKLMM